MTVLVLQAAGPFLPVWSERRFQRLLALVRPVAQLLRIRRRPQSQGVGWLTWLAGWGAGVTPLHTPMQHYRGLILK